MLVNRNKMPDHLRDEDRRWRRRAWLYFLVSVGITIATPHLAQLWVENHWAGVTSTAISVTVTNWIGVYFISGIITLVAFEISHYAILRGKRSEPPAFMVQMIEEIAKEAGITAPLLVFEPGKKIRAATSSSFMSGSKIYWQGAYDQFTHEEIRAVLAHEIAHIAMFDTRTSLVKHLLLGGLRLLAVMQFAVMVVALMLSFLNLFPWFIGHGVLFAVMCYALWSRTGDAITGGVFAAILLYSSYTAVNITGPMVFAFTTSLVGTVLAVLASHAYSRVIEYRADAVAIDLIGPEYADDLASALDRFYKMRLNTKKKRRLYKQIPEFLMTHPRMVDRQIALKMRQMLDASKRSLSVLGFTN